jgi:cation:H+ antiporter
MLLEIVLLAVGIGFLVKGSDLLVDAAERLALAAGVPTLIVGFTLVAAGTSVPELVIGLNAVFDGVGELVIGDVVGSNIADICLVLGVAALISPIRVKPSIAKLDIPAIFVISLLFGLLALDGQIGRMDGLVLLAAAVAYFYLILRNLKKARPAGAVPVSAGWQDIALMVAGIAAVVIGGKVTVDAAVSIATGLGINPYLIGLTIVAIGTSLPELVTSAVAARKGSGDLILGNNLGSFSFNALVITGLCALISPLVVPDFLDLTVMAVACALLFPLVLRGFVLDKWEGVCLVVFYGAYIGYKVLTPGV